MSLQSSFSAVMITWVLSGFFFFTIPVFGNEVPGELPLNTLTVTARKVKEDILKIPVPVSLFTGTFLNDARIENTMELVRHVPNVYFKKSTSENMISIRGVTAFDSSIYSPAAFYVDDVLLPLHYMHNLDFYDLERVEVLKGPQGTLYGGNSESGVINVITKKPGDEFSGRISAQTGVYSSMPGDPLFAKTGFSLSGPVLADRLSFGVSAILENNQGVMTNLVTDNDMAGSMKRYNGRLSLVYTPSDRWDISLVADAMKNNDNIAVYRFETGPYQTNPYMVRHEQTDWSDEDGSGQALKIKYEGPAWEFLSVTGHRDYVNKNQQDYDNTADPANNWGEVVSEYDDRIFTQEFRISSVTDGPFTWLGGLYGFTEATRINRDNATAMDRDNTEIDNRGWALFGTGTYTFFNRFHFEAGLRYDAQYQEGTHHREYIDAGTGLTASRRLAKDQDVTEVLPRMSLGWDLTPGIYTYALVSKGYLSGGYNYAMAVDESSLTYNPEYVWNHEIGLKGSWFNNRIVSNLSVFYLKIEDKQVYEQLTGSNPGTKIDNAAKAHTKGIEIEITARPVRGLDLIAGLGFISGEYDDWIATEWNDTYTGYVKTDYSGKSLPNVPEYTFNLGVQYRFRNGIFIRGDVNGVGEFYGDHANTVKEKAYALVNLKLGYETEDFDIYLWGKNVFDKHYHTIKYEWDGAELVQDGTPFSIGLSLVWRF